MRSAQEELLERLRSALLRGPPLRLALVFGSFARGVARADSDIDVGIVPADPGLPVARELGLQVELSDACSRQVDLVRLDRAPTLLRWQAARDGVSLLADPPCELPRFRARAAVEHAELRVVRDRAAERFRERLAQAEERSHT